MIKFRPRLGDLNEIISESVTITCESDLFIYLEERSIYGEELRFAQLDESLILKARQKNPKHQETHIILLDGKVIGYSDGILDREYALE